MIALIIIIIINFIIYLKIDKIIKTLNIYDFPDKERKIHSKKTSKFGGTLILINILLVYFLYYRGGFNSIQNSLFIFSSSIAIFLLGLVDDIKDLKPNLKLILCIVFVLIFLFNENSFIIKELKFSFIEKQFNLGLLSIFFTTFCFVVFINALNMFDGINLQVVLYSSFLFITNCFISQNYFSIILFLPLIIVLLILNFKNKLFLGDSGSLLLGFLISCVFIFNYNNNLIIYADTIFIFMMLPGIELIRLTISRLLKNKNPFSADKTHIHHLLLRKYNYNSVILINFLLVILPISAHLLFSINSLFIISISIFLYFCGIYWISKD